MKTISDQLAAALVKLRAAQLDLAEWELGKLRGFRDEFETRAHRAALLVGSLTENEFGKDQIQSARADAGRDQATG